MVQEGTLLAGVEAGGTTWVLAISKDTPENIVDRVEFATSTPRETIEQALAWLRTKTFHAIGIASFGPVDLNMQSETFGYITSTPKPNWANTALVDAFREFDVPIGFETDVNAPAMYIQSHRRSADKPKESICYITLGTGIGVGVCVSGQPVHGHQHPEGGHLYVPIHEDDLKTGFEGTCPFHKNCVEGMAAAGSIAARTQVERTKLHEIPSHDNVWKLQAHYLAQLCVSLTLIASPHAIVLGGGMAKRDGLHEDVRRMFKQYLNDYVQVPPLDEYIIPAHHPEIGLVSSIDLARQALEGEVPNVHPSHR